MHTKPRNIGTITFSLSPFLAQKLRKVVKEEHRTVSEFLREAIRLYVSEREWHNQERLERRRADRTEHCQTEGEETDQ